MTPIEQARRDLLSEFRTTARERLARITDEWRAAQGASERGVPPAVLNELHSLTGEANLMGFGDAGEVAGRVKGLLDRLSDTPPDDWYTVGDAIHAAVGMIERLIGALPGGQDAGLDVPPFLAELYAAFGVADPSTLKSGAQGEAQGPGPTRDRGASGGREV